MEYKDQYEQEILTAEQPQPAEPEPKQTTVDEEYSLPLSARREQGWRKEWEAGREQELHRDQAPSPPPQPPSLPPKFKEIPPEQGFTARSVVEGALALALSVVLAVISNYLPVVNIVGTLLYPMPIVVLALRQGMKVCYAATAALFAVSALFFGLPQALSMLLAYGGLGLYLGYSFRQRQKPMTALTIASLIAAVGMVLMLLLSLFISGLPFSDLSRQLELSGRDVMAMWNESGMLTERILRGLTVEEFTDIVLVNMKRLLPSYLVVLSMGLAALFYLIASKILRRLGYDVNRLPRFSELRLDWRLAWGVIAGLGLEFIGQRVHLDWLTGLGSNIAYIFLPLLLVCGISFLAWYLKNSGISLPFKVLILVLVVQMLGITIYLLMLAAVLESIYDLRARLAVRFQRKAAAKAKDEKDKRMY